MRTATARDGESGMKRAGLHAGEHAVPLLAVEVRAEVAAGHSRAVVRQRYRNDESKPVEAVYTFPLPARGAVIGFAMTVGGRQLAGEVHEREDAFRRYDDAISAGHGGALLEQERANVFTANVGNLLPGEETVIEIEYVEPLHAEEGAIRWNLPTLVAPRYIPGAAAGDRTAHGTADPTSRVPDADRISPPVGAAPYGLSLELLFDLGCEVDVESPSHDLRTESAGNRTRVFFAQREVALDRDVVVTAVPRKSASAAAPLATVVAHRSGGGGEGRGNGVFAVSIVPDLAAGLKRRNARNDVVFVLDRSGSMGGTSMNEAKTALRLCLRQLREGDRFAIIAFDDTIELMSPGMVKLTRATLADADRWIDEVDARGGTELLEPLVRAVELAPDGVIVLLTDGQVGNEDEIEKQLLARRARARVYSFGIGTNVSDALLVALATKTGGAVETIHPGERVDDKVVAQFARATAPRVTDLRVAFRGVEVGEIAPADPAALIDGEPLTVFGTYEAPGFGAVEIRGVYEGEKFYLEVPFDLPEREERPTVVKLWAQARIRDLETAVLSGRRAETMRARVVELAKAHRVSSRYTSFVVVEKRTGDRRINEQAETRVVPVNAPSGWALLSSSRGRRSYAMASLGAPPPPMAAAPMSAPYGAPMPQANASGAAYGPASSRSKGKREDAGGAERDTSDDAMTFVGGLSSGDAFGTLAESAQGSDGLEVQCLADASAFPAPRAVSVDGFGRGGHGASSAADPLTTLLERQSASGLWEAPGRTPIEATVDALLVLLRLGISTSHPVHGAQTKKAVEALLDALAAASSADAKLAELALGTLWLLSTGRRTRSTIKQALSARHGLEALAAVLGRDDEVRAYVERIAPPS